MNEEGEAEEEEEKEEEEEEGEGQGESGRQVRPQLKRNLIKFLIRGLPTRDKLAHFTNQNSSC